MPLLQDSEQVSALRNEVRDIFLNPAPVNYDRVRAILDILDTEEGERCRSKVGYWVSPTPDFDASYIHVMSLVALRVAYDNPGFTPLSTKQTVSAAFLAELIERKQSVRNSCQDFTSESCAEEWAKHMLSLEGFPIKGFCPNVQEAAKQVVKDAAQYVGYAADAHVSRLEERSVQLANDLDDIAAPVRGNTRAGIATGNTLGGSSHPVANPS